MTHIETASTDPTPPPDVQGGRRGFLSASTLLMAGGLAAGYGTLGVMMGQFVYPAQGTQSEWLFVCTVEQLSPGAALDFATPGGLKIVVARLGQGAEAEDFLALSSVCPHLGCRVHWEAQHDRFFCPCHNGAFDRSGIATAGPPLAARQTLVRYPLQVSSGLLFLEAPLANIGGEHVAAACCTSSTNNQGVG